MLKKMAWKQEKRETGAISSGLVVGRYFTLALWLKAFVTGAILYLVLSRVELHVARAIFLNVQVPFLAAALILLLPMGFTAALRWRSVAAACGERLRFRDALLYCWIGQFFNLGLPIVGFDGMRAWKLHQQGTPLGLAARIVVFDRLCALASLVFVTTLGMPRILTASGDGWFQSAAVVALLVGVSALAFLVLFRNLAPFLPNIPLFKPLLALSDELNVVATKGIAAKALSWGVCNHLCRVALVILLAYSIGTDLHAYDAFAFAPVALLIAMVPVSLGGWGVREVVFISAFGLVGITAAQALGLSVLFGLTGLLAGLLGGVIWMFEQHHLSRALPERLHEPSNAVTKPL